MELNNMLRPYIADNVRVDTCRGATCRAFSASAIVLGLSLVSALSAQTRIPPRAIVNAASFARPGLPHGKIARGSIFTIFGSRIGPDSPATVSAFPLGRSLGGVTITVTQGETSVEAIPLFVSAAQINAIMPSDAPLGMVSVRVRNGPRRSNPAPVEIVESSVGIFTATGAGAGPGIVQNFVTQAVQPINSPRAAAARRQIVTIWATGLGPAPFPDDEAPVPRNLDVEIEIRVGGALVAPEDVLYFGRSPCCAGVDQIIIRVPADAPEGCYAPVHIRTNRGVVSNSVTMAIAEEGVSCGLDAAPLRRAQSGPVRSGVVLLAHLDGKIGVDLLEPFDFSADFGLAAMRETAGGPFDFDPLTALPPPGACTTYGWAGPLARGFPGGSPSRFLDAGTELEARGPLGRRAIPAVGELRLGPFNYAAILGGSTGLPFLGGPYLRPGSYRISGPGGADLEPIEAETEVPTPAEWTNRDEVGVIDRAVDLTIRWAAPEALDQLILISGGNHDLPTDSAFGFVCLTPASASKFTVPAWLLSGVPPSRPEPYQSDGAVFVWTLSTPAAPIAGSNLDQGLATGMSGYGKLVVFE